MWEIWIQRKKNTKRNYKIIAFVNKK